MTSAEVLDRVRPILPKLQSSGVLELRLFGSTVYDEAKETSDVDFLVKLDRPSYDLYCAVLDELERVLGVRVDLVMVEAVKPRLRDSILREAKIVA